MKYSSHFTKGSVIFALLQALSLILTLSAIMTLSACSNSVSSEPSKAPSLHAISLEKSLYLSWDKLQDATGYIVEYRKDQDSQWTTINVGDVLTHTISNLDNDTHYSLRVTAYSKDGLLNSSAEFQQTPTIREEHDYVHFNGFDPRMSIFTSQAGADAWLRSNNIDPLTMECRNNPIFSWNSNSPNCIYTVNNELIILQRAFGSKFSNSNPERSPEAIREATRQAIWAAANPFDHPEKFPIMVEKLDPPATGIIANYQTATSYIISYHKNFSSRITWFVPFNPLPNKYAIFHEGHGGSAEVAGPTIEWLLDQGWQVITADMPLYGGNAADRTPEFTYLHQDFFKLDDGITSPVGLFLLPVKSIVDFITASNSSSDKTILMMGHSGGGWTSYLYATLDSRIDYVVSVAGGTPLSERLKDGKIDTGDYEQFAPELYDRVSHEELMLAAGARGALYMYNKFDTYFWMDENDPYVAYFRSTAERANRNS
ncbi:MAG TPA: fibronectin type III domain-containing protein [Chitinophagaceae bacterium]|nr:fibronectin type III domain-containing protein [Chitinophagaceae bacterium]